MYFFARAFRFLPWVHPHKLSEQLTHNKERGGKSSRLAILGQSILAGYRTSAIRADRLGSYSNRTTSPSPASRGLLKSIMRYSRLWPPPRCQTVIRPVLRLRPPVFLNPLVRGLYGPWGHNSSRAVIILPRKPVHCLHPQTPPRRQTQCTSVTL